MNAEVMSVKRMLLVLALFGALALVGAPTAAAKGRPQKTPPSITYIWGQRVSESQIDVVARVLPGSPTYRVTDQFTFYDSAGVAVGSCGGFTRLYSGAGSPEWSSGIVSATPVPENAATIGVTVTITDKRGRILDVESGVAAVPDVLASAQFWPPLLAA